VRPNYGKLFHLRGKATALTGPIQVTLTSEMGSMTTMASGDGSFSFEPLAPGPYELLATAPGVAEWVPINLERDTDGVRMALGRLPQVDVILQDNNGQRAEAAVMMRRKDVAGE